tara:strand:+ start:365 stop:1678 length:1314 start_codon:yes stop_codon:yes gene_type:complete
MFGELSEEQKLEKNVVKIFGEDKYRYLSGILMFGDRQISDKIPTACTNGRDELYGREMVKKLSDAELRYVIVHEAKHKAYMHLITWDNLNKIDSPLANKAMDYVINLELEDENKDDKFCVMPKGEYQGLLDERFRNMDTAQVFKILRQEQEDEDGNGDGSGQCRGEDGDDETEGQGQGQDQGQGSDSDSGGSDTENQGQNGFDEHDWEGAQGLTDEEATELKKGVDAAIRQGVMAAGKGSGTDNQNVKDILQPQVDWREVLRAFATVHCSGNDYATYSRPNRRYLHTGLVFPSGISETLEEICVMPDMSGSCWSVLDYWAAEIKNICEVVKPDRLRVLYWDDAVPQDEVYEMHELDKFVSSTKPKGGGGTDPEILPKYIKEKGYKPTAGVVLTDGIIFNGWGEWDIPVLWCVLDNRNVQPDCGQTVHIKSTDLIKGI